MALPKTHRGKNYGWEFVEALNKVVEEEVLDELKKATHFCLLVDESTDVAMTKHLVLYVNYRFGVSN